MKNYLSLVALSLLLFLLPLQSTDSNKYKEVQLEGFRITMVLQKTTPEIQLAEWPAEAVTLSAQSVAVDGLTIDELLRSNNIFPDVEAFGVVYALNPSIPKLSELNVPRIRIPKVQGGSTLQARFAEGFVILVTMDKELKDEFRQKVTKLSELTQTVSSWGPQRFEQNPARAATINSLTQTSDRLKGIAKRINERFGRSVPADVLRPLNAEVELLNTTLGAIALSGRPIRATDQKLIVAIEKDVAIKSGAFREVAAGAAPDRWPEVSVLVKTLRNGQPIPNLRVYYAPEALKTQSQEVRSFGILSPSTQKLSEADYCFWAARDPGKTPVTNEHCQEIRTGQEPIEIQLTVNH